MVGASLINVLYPQLFWSTGGLGCRAFRKFQFFRHPAIYFIKPTHKNENSAQSHCFPSHSSGGSSGIILPLRNRSSDDQASNRGGCWTKLENPSHNWGFVWCNQHVWNFWFSCWMDGTHQSGASGSRWKWVSPRSWSQKNPSKWFKMLGSREPNWGIASAVRDLLFYLAVAAAVTKTEWVIIPYHPRNGFLQQCWWNARQARPNHAVGGMEKRRDFTPFRIKEYSPWHAETLELLC